MEELTKTDLREALVLVLAELRDLPPFHRQPMEAAERVGELQGHIQTLMGNSPYGTEPIYGLRALRRRQSERAAPPLPRRVASTAPATALTDDVVTRKV